MIRHKPKLQSIDLLYFGQPQIVILATFPYLQKIIRTCFSFLMSFRRSFSQDSNKFIPHRLPKIVITGSASLSSGTLGLQTDLDPWIPEELRPAHSSLPHVGFSAKNEDWNM